MYSYDVDLHFNSDCNAYWDTYTVSANCIDKARYLAIARVISETGFDNAKTIDLIRVYKSGTNKMYKEYEI